MLAPKSPRCCSSRPKLAPPFVDRATMLHATVFPPTVHAARPDFPSPRTSSATPEFESHADAFSHIRESCRANERRLLRLWVAAGAELDERCLAAAGW